MSESNSVIGQINNLNILFTQLLGVDVNIIESKHIGILLQSLLDSYDQLIINITNNNTGICIPF